MKKLPNIAIIIVIVFCIVLGILIAFKIYKNHQKAYYAEDFGIKKIYLPDGLMLHYLKKE